MASQNKIGDRFLGEDGKTTWTIADRVDGKFLLTGYWGSQDTPKVMHLSAQKINALVNSGRLTRVK